MKTLINLVLLFGALGLFSCSISPKVQQREILENSLRGESMPKWVAEAKVAWEEDSNHYFKSSYTVAGNQRINGCYDLAKLELKENLLSELSQDVKGELNLANEGISEGLDPLITKSVRTSIDGTIRGLKTQEQIFERYKISDIERVDCYVKSSMTKSDYQLLKNSVLKQMASVNAEVAEAVRKRQKDFFKSDE